MSQRVGETVELPADRTSRNLAAWSMLTGLLLLAALAGPFFAGWIYTADDLGAFHLPIRAFYADRLANGQPYDWMPQLFSGFYLTGEGQAGMYHPLHLLLYRFLSLRAALGWEYLLPYPLMMLGTWLLLRRRLGRSDAAMFGGLLFTFSSFNLLHFVHPNAIAVIAHIPWLLWAIDIALVDSRRRRVALATALVALLTGSQLLLGYPQFVWFSLVAEFCYVVFLQTAHKYAARTGCDLCRTCNECIGCTAQIWPRVVIAKGIGLLMGGIQLLPTLDAWLHSARLSADAGFTFWGSLHPLNLLQLVAPYMFAGRVIGDSPHEFGLYVGAVPLVLTVWAVARQRELGSLKPAAWTALGLALLMLLLSFGRYGFLYQITAWLPVLRSFRFPCRYLVLFQFAVAILASIGFVLLIRQSGEARQQRARGLSYVERRPWLRLWRDFEPLWCLLGFSAGVAVVGLTLSHEAYIASVPAILTGPVLLAAAAVLVALAVRGYSAALVGLILLAGLDLGWYGLSYSVYQHVDTAVGGDSSRRLCDGPCGNRRQESPPTIARLEEYAASAHTPPGNTNGRVVASLFRVDQPGLRTGDLMTLSGWRRADGYAGLEPRQQLDYRLLPSLRVAGVRWVQRNPSTIDIAGLKPCGDLWLEVPDPLPRLRLVTRVQTSNDPAADIARICPDNVALSEVPLVLPAAGGTGSASGTSGGTGSASASGGTGTASASGGTGSASGTAVLTAERPGQLDIEVDCPAPQLLVVAESYHRGWRATVDGQSQEVSRINGDFMGCVVGPGKHRVVLSFQPGSLRRGRLTSCIGLAMFSVCFLGSFVGAKPGRWKDDLP
jgi:hypothetical protein